MLPIAAGFIAGLALAALAFWITGGGFLGLALAVLVAAGSYIAVSSLLTPDRRIGGMVAEFVPEGEKALKAIDDAKRTLRIVSDASARIRDADIRREIQEFGQGFNALIHYVERNPAAHDVLRHYDVTYGPQVIQLLSSYADVESSGSPQSVGESRAATVRAMDQVEKAARGELDRAVADRRLQLDANASAIRQLTAMDGYRSGGGDGPGESGAIDFNAFRNNRQGEQ